MRLGLCVLGGVVSSVSTDSLARSQTYVTSNALCARLEAIA